MIDLSYQNSFKISLCFIINKYFISIPRLGLFKNFLNEMASWEEATFLHGSLQAGNHFSRNHQESCLLLKKMFFHFPFPWNKSSEKSVKNTTLAFYVNYLSVICWHKPLNQEPLGLLPVNRRFTSKAQFKFTDSTKGLPLFYKCPF
jgi:hypothetical protein